MPRAGGDDALQHRSKCCSRLRSYEHSYPPAEPRNRWQADATHVAAPSRGSITGTPPDALKPQMLPWDVIGLLLRATDERRGNFRATGRQRSVRHNELGWRTRALSNLNEYGIAPTASVLRHRAAVRTTLRSAAAGQSSSSSSRASLPDVGRVVLTADPSVPQARVRAERQECVVV